MNRTKLAVALVVALALPMAWAANRYGETAAGKKPEAEVAAVNTAARAVAPTDNVARKIKIYPSL